ncbi:MAG: hypothetical protein NVSMB23_10080 [Myxococcales bacterium]
MSAGREERPPPQGAWKQAHILPPPFSGEMAPEQHLSLPGVPPSGVTHSVSVLQGCTHQPVQALP